MSSSLAAIAFAAVAFLLIGATRSATAQAQQNEQINSVVQSWLQQTPGTRITGFEHDVESNRLSIEVSGPLQPPDKGSLRPLLDPILGDVLLSVQWVKTEEATTTTLAVTTTLAPTEQELQRERINDVVDEWLVLEDNGNGYELQGVFFDGNSLRVDVIGAGEPPSVNDLSEMLAAQIDSPLELDVTWVRRDVAQPGTTVPNPLEIQQDEMADIIATFASENDLSVASFQFDGSSIELELVGQDQPETTDLVVALQSVAGDTGLAIDVYFTQRLRLETTTTTLATTTLETTTTSSP